MPRSSTLEKRAKDGKPFLISLHFTAPHWPWEANDEAGKAESARAAAPGGPDNAFGYDSGSMETYAKMMLSLDENVGRVLDKLKDLDLDENTVVVFTSDNGGERFSNTWPFTGKKTELLEGGIRVPAIVRWPGVTKPGSTSEEEIISMDWLPTFVAAAGAEAGPCLPRATASTSRRPIAGGKVPERTLFWRYTNKGQKAAPCAASGSISKFPGTASCSTSSPTRSNGRTLKTASRRRSRSWKPPLPNGTRACCSIPRRRATALPASNLRIISA